MTNDMSYQSTNQIQIEQDSGIKQIEQDFAGDPTEQIET
jgi:hypothetical protein